MPTTAVTHIQMASAEQVGYVQIQRIAARFRILLPALVESHQDPVHLSLPWFVSPSHTNGTESGSTSPYAE